MGNKSSGTNMAGTINQIMAKWERNDRLWRSVRAWRRLSENKHTLWVSIDMAGVDSEGWLGPGGGSGSWCVCVSYHVVRGKTLGSFNKSRDVEWLCLWTGAKRAKKYIYIIEKKSKKNKNGSFPSWLTFTPPFYLTHAVQSVRHQVRQPPVQVHWRQAALEALLSMHELGELLEHLLRHAADVQVAWRETKNATILTPGGQRAEYKKRSLERAWRSTMTLRFKDILWQSVISNIIINNNIINYYNG